MLFSLAAICSGDAATSKMSWAEFKIVFSYLGIVALIFGVLHQGFWGWILHKHRPDPSGWALGWIVSLCFTISIPSTSFSLECTDSQLFCVLLS